MCLVIWVKAGISRLEVTLVRELEPIMSSNLEVYHPEATAFAQDSLLLV